MYSQEHDANHPWPKTNAASPNRPKAALVTVLSLVCGIAACVLNGLLVTLPIGVLFSLLALICGLISRRRYGASGGFVLALLSFLIIAFWMCSIVIPWLVDPTITILDRF
jgi:energy-coupling factor transporter transmembrane protein EcfT